MLNKDFRRVKNISPDLEMHYKNYFERNTTKFIWKWGMKLEDLEKIWISGDSEYSLIGQVSENTFILKKMEDNTRWFVSVSKFKKEFSKNE